MAQERVAQELVEGWTDPIIDQLLISGLATESLVGHTIECLLWDKLGVAKVGLGVSALFDGVTRKVSFTPAGPGSLVAIDSPYFQRWKITRPDGKVYFHPNGAAERWVVLKP